MKMTRQRCRALRRAGHSIGRIAKTLQLSESTVHWHVKDIVLTQRQRQRLQDHWRRIMQRVNARRRGQPLRKTTFRNPAWSGPLVHLIAHLAFDGRVDRYGCAYYSRMRQQAVHVQQLLRRLLGVHARLRQRPDNGIWVVSYYNVAVATWLSKKERELLHVVAEEGRISWKREWLQAFFDDEGHIHIRNGVRRVRASQDDPLALSRAQRFLEEFRIRSRVDRRARAVEITGRDNLVLFRKQVNFSPGIRINHHRKNGLWSQPLEKRQLLDLALQSYRN